MRIIEHTPRTTQVGLELFVDVTDEDFVGNDPVDMITIPFSDDWRADSTFNPSITRLGSCGRASLTVSVRIVSLCPANMYGPQCTQECIERANQNTCNYLGEVRCLGNFAPPDITGFQAPDCVDCAANYYPASVCDVFCVPRNDSRGHYICGPSGQRICLPRYTDPDTFCVDCLGNYLEPDCIECEANFQGSSCEDCAANYYPEGECDVFCVPRDDSGGHFTCNPVTGERECLGGFTDPETNCTREVTAISDPGKL